MNEYVNANEPSISVIIPVYNGAAYIETTIRSVLQQTYSNWEMLVIDDGSVDSTRSIVRRLAEEDSRVKLIENPINMGVAKTRNRGLSLSRGAYVALLDGDDVWRPEKLEKQVELAISSGADIVYCSYGIIDGQGKKLCNDFVVPEQTDYDEMLVKSVINCSTALLSRYIVENYSFRTDYYHEDLLLWLEILRDKRLARGVVDVLADYRVLRGSRSFNKVNSAIQRWNIYRKYMKEPFFKSVKLIARYATLALKKYKKI